SVVPAVLDVFKSAFSSVKTLGYLRVRDHGSGVKSPASISASIFSSAFSCLPPEEKSSSISLSQAILSRRAMCAANFAKSPGDNLSTASSISVRLISTRQISPRAGLGIFFFFHHVQHTEALVRSAIAMAQQVRFFFQFEDGSGKLTTFFARELWKLSNDFGRAHATN